MPITQATRVGYIRAKRRRKNKQAELARGSHGLPQMGGAEVSPAKWLSAKTHVPDFHYVDSDDDNLAERAQTYLLYADRGTRRRHPFSLEITEMVASSDKQSRKQNWKRAVDAKEWALEALNGDRVIPAVAHPVSPREEAIKRLVEAKALVERYERILKEMP